ncbi:unnamed protein product [Sphagnum balticum]
MQVYKEVEEFLVKFPSCFLAKRWKSTIADYLTNMDATPVASKAVAPFPAECVMTLAHATSNNNATSTLVLQAHDIQRRLGGVGGSRQTLPQQQRHPPSNRKLQHDDHPADERDRLLMEKEMHLDVAIGQRRMVSNFVKEFVRHHALDQPILPTIIPNHYDDERCDDDGGDSDMTLLIVAPQI